MNRLPPEASARSWRGRLATYLLALLLVGFTLLARMAMAPEWDGGAVAIIFVPAILLSASFGGIGSGLLATASASLGSAYFLMPPTFSFSVKEPVQRVQFGLLWAAGIAISMLVEVLHRTRWKLESRTAMVRESEERFRALASRMRLVREEEQARIARDLHDELGQLLTGLSLDLQRLENKIAQPDRPPGGLEDAVVTAASLVDQAQASVRRIASGLLPQALDSLGLGPALQEEAHAFADHSGIECEVTVGDVPVLPPPVATALYRIAQEALTNVARHAGATRVAIRLAPERGGVVLHVEDNGRGFTNRSGAEAGLGLLGMRERAAQLGGEVRLARGANGGATVATYIPLGREGGPKKSGSPAE